MAAPSEDETFLLSGAIILDDDPISFLTLSTNPVIIVDPPASTVGGEEEESVAVLSLPPRTASLIHRWIPPNEPRKASPHL
jgi:hypothetical protein